MLWLIPALVGICFSDPAWATQDDIEYAPKISLRLSSGSLTNLGFAGGSSINFGGLNIQYLGFITSHFAWGAGYRIDFDMKNYFIPLRGVDLTTRWYFHNQGTRSKVRAEELSTTVRDSIAFYALGELSQRTYYLGSNPVLLPGQEQNGTFFSLNSGVGCDFRLARNWELNAEGDFGLLTFAATDNRVRVSSMLFKVGFSYLW